MERRAFARSNNTCTPHCHTVAAGGSCTITVSFTPPASGTFTGNVTFTDDAAGSPHVANLSGTGLSAYACFNPPAPDFGNVTLGKAGPTHAFALTNTSSAPLVITTVTKAGNVGAFAIPAITNTCTGRDPRSEQRHLQLHGAVLGHRGGLQTAIITVNDTAPDGATDGHRDRHGTRPAAFTNVRGLVGCTTATLQWTVGPSVAGSWIVRNANHIPKNQHDGTRIRATGKGVRQEKGLKQFHTYHYAIWAQYHGLTPGSIVYSAVKHVNLRTGRICKPQRGAKLTGLRPTIDWSSVPGIFGYGMLIYQPRPRGVPVDEAHDGLGAADPRGPHLKHGQPYTVYVYAYSTKHPKGIGIGSSSFSVK